MKYNKSIFMPVPSFKEAEELSKKTKRLCTFSDDSDQKWIAIADLEAVSHIKMEQYNQEKFLALAAMVANEPNSFYEGELLVYGSEYDPTIVEIKPPVGFVWPMNMQELNDKSGIGYTIRKASEYEIHKLFRDPALNPEWIPGFGEEIYCWDDDLHRVKMKFVAKNTSKSAEFPFIVAAISTDFDNHFSPKIFKHIGKLTDKVKVPIELAKQYFAEKRNVPYELIEFTDEITKTAEGNETQG